MSLRGFYTLYYKEVLRFAKVSAQTMLAPVVTALLFLAVFSQVLQDRVTIYSGITYVSFLVPGLIMMTIIQNAFANSSSSLAQSKITGNIVFVLLAPLSYLEFFLAFVLAAMTRGILVGLIVACAASFFHPLSIYSFFYIAAFALLGSGVLAAFGIIAGIWAEKFDHLAAFQNFVVMPLSFLSGVFYSIHVLPPFWRQLSHANPFFYMIDGFRFGFFGQSDVSPLLSLSVVALFLLVLSVLTLWLLRRGYRLRD